MESIHLRTLGDSGIGEQIRVYLDPHQKIAENEVAHWQQLVRGFVIVTEGTIILWTHNFIAITVLARLSCIINSTQCNM